MSQPVSELVADICHDIGPTPDWKRLAEEAWAQDEIDSGEVGKALADYSEGAASPASGRGRLSPYFPPIAFFANARIGSLTLVSGLSKANTSDTWLWRLL